jgi:hypothetical protein
MGKKQYKTQIKEQLAAAGIRQADIGLATETSEALLELLAAYPIDDLLTHRQRKSIKDLFEDAAAAQLRARDL